MTADQRLRSAGAALREQAANTPLPPIERTYSREVNDMDKVIDPNQRGGRRLLWSAGAAVAAAILLVVLALDDNSDQDGLGTVDQPDTTATSVAPTTETTNAASTSLPPVECLELHNAPGLSNFVEVCSAEVDFANGRPRALIDIDALGDDCEALRSVSDRWRAEVRDAVEAWSGPIAAIQNQPEVSAAAAFDTYAVEQGVIQGCQWAEDDLANKRGGDYTIFADS